MIFFAPSLRANLAREPRDASPADECSAQHFPPLAFPGLLRAVCSRPMRFREEQEGDRAGVRAVNLAAFARPSEADLVDALRASGCPSISLVAVEGDEVVGHVLLTPVTVEPRALERGGRVRDAFALGPLAVAPRRQREGIGSELVRQGLEACRAAGHGVVFVLGHADYYPRFGFVPAASWGLACELDVPPEVFLVTELWDGAARGWEGVVRYRPEFRAV